jgi:hypothetical protein
MIRRGLLTGETGLDGDVIEERVLNPKDLEWLVHLLYRSSDFLGTLNREVFKLDCPD